MPLKRIAKVAVLSLALVSAAPLAAPTHAGDYRGEGGGARVHAERAISLDEAVSRAEQRYKARAVRAEEKRHGDRIEYRIRLLGEDGRVFEIRIDATTGREG
jgi:uncharacterized membrane protein YkoI